MKHVLPSLFFVLAFHYSLSQCIPVCNPLPLDSIGILNVSLSSLNNSSPSLQCYVDYTAVTAPQLISGESYLMSVAIGLNTNPSTINTQELWVLVDWSSDGDFLDGNEIIRINTSLGPQATDAFILTVPGGTANGNYIMRVMSSGAAFILDECTINGGDVEDYTIQVVNPFNMGYQSLDASQMSNTCIQPGSQDVKLLLVEVEMVGNLNPLQAITFNFNTTGSTNTADISQAKLHYLGINPNNPLGNVFGTIGTPAGAFSITGNQNLNIGKNYFALSYDLVTGATVGNNLDAQFIDFTYTAPTNVVVPATSNPAGNEVISPLVSLPYTKRASRWYFGDHIGFNFNCGPVPDILDDGITQSLGCSSLEGTTTISDDNGNLLFYSFEGLVVNRFHGIMPNGIGLLGGCSSTQGYLPVPNPTNPDQYYLFTIEASGAAIPGLYYSIVDMTLDGGNGDVVFASKNTVVNNNVTERLTSVHHCNNQDVWIITHDATNFYTYLITNTGIQPAVVSPIPNNPNTSAGQLKVSPTGMHIGEVELGATHWYSFDNETGEVCWIETSTTTGGYGCSFSNDGSKFYTGEFFQGLYQYDMTAQPIIPSAVQIYASSGSNYGHMQLAPDGKLYWFDGSSGTDTMASVINSPNLPGALCDYHHDTIHFKHSSATNSTYGSVNYIQSWFLDTSYVEPGITASFSFMDTCYPGPVQFYDSSTYHVECPRYLWDFDDPVSGANNASTDENPVHIFSAPGSYNVKLILKERCKTDSIIIIVDIFGTTSTHDTLPICDGDSILIGGGYQTTSGTYIDTLVSTAGCDSISSITLTIKLPITSTSPTSICEGDSLFLEGAWQTNAGSYMDSLIGGNGCDSIVTTNLTVNQIISENIDIGICTGDSLFLQGAWQTTTGIYVDTLATTNTGCDSIIITNLAVNSVITTASTATICEGDSLFIGGGYQSIAGAFSDTLPGPGGCDSILTTTLIINDLPTIQLTGDTTIIPGDIVILLGSGGTSYTWNTGETTPGITVSPEQTTTYLLTVTNDSGCTDTAYVTVIVEDEIIEGELFIPNIFSPNGDGSNDVFYVRGTGFSGFQLIIYNRWGEKVFETTENTAGWDGTYKEEPLNPGVFVYYVFASYTTDGSEVTKKGNITLIK